jgi:hypothetical protein
VTFNTMTKPDTLRAAAQKLRQHPTDPVRLAVSWWLWKAAYQWDTLRLAAADVLDTTDPKQANAAAVLNRGPYDAGEAMAVAQEVLAEVAE